jgi:hypothetical protein
MQICNNTSIWTLTDSIDNFLHQGGNLEDPELRLLP